MRNLMLPKNPKLNTYIIVSRYEYTARLCLFLWVCIVCTYVSKQQQNLKAYITQQLIINQVLSENFFCLITWFVTKNVYSFREIKIYHSLPARAVIEMCKFSSSSILIIHLVNICIFETHEKIPKKQQKYCSTISSFFA